MNVHTVSKETNAGTKHAMVDNKNLASIESAEPQVGGEHSGTLESQLPHCHPID